MKTGWLADRQSEEGVILFLRGSSRKYYVRST